MIVAVTGGAGFLGQRVVSRFSDRGDEVRVLDVASRPATLRREATYRRGDVLDTGALIATLRGADVVVHVAFAPPSASAERLQLTNAVGPAVVASAAARAGARRLVLISSTIVERALRPHPRLAHAPLSRLATYRATRVEGEDALQSTPGDLQTAIVRPKTFLGPGRVGGFALAFASVRSGGTVPIAGPGTNRYQYVHVDDLADGVVRLADAASEGVFHFGAPDVGTVRGELSALIDAAGTGARGWFLSPRVGRMAVRAVELAGFPPLSEFHHAAAFGWDSVVDSSRARCELQWRPLRSNFDTLRDAYEWYSANADRASITTHPVPASHRAARRVLALASSRRRAARAPASARR